MKYEPHPIAGIFPMMSGQALETLEADIKANGLQSSGLLYEGKILDGRNRYAVCCKLGIEMYWEEVELGEPEDIAAFDPVQYVLSHNLHRRHLKPSQRAMIGAKIATLKHGQVGNGRVELPIGGSTREDTAALLGIGTRSIDRAKVVLDQGSEELIEAVEQCAVSVSAAHELCHQCPDKQEQSKLVREGRKAIAEFLRPTEQEADSVDPYNDEFDYPFIKAWEQCDYRLNTLRKIVDGLNENELAVLKDWVGA